MAFEYKGRYYATLASQRAAILRDEYKNNQGALKAFQTIAAQQVKPQYSRQPNIQAQRDLATWEIAKSFEKAQQQAAPAPAPARSAPAPAPAPAPDNRLAELTAQSEAYRKEAESAIEAGKLRIQQLEDEELQRQKATELQNRLAIQSAASKARGQMQASLKIAPASQTAQTAGTQAFKRRRDRTRLAPIQSTAGINVPTGSILNV